MFLSVIISTYNRCESLRETLRSLDQQELTAPAKAEILIVNNNSTDQTSEVVKEAASVSAWPMRHIFEPRQGISAARNRGIRESRGEFLLFTDDDVIVQPGWIQAYQKVFQDYGADCASGKIIPRWEKKPEPWMLDPAVRSTIGGVFALLDHGDQTRIFEELDFNFFYGANMAFRKSALVELGGFREDLGMVGTKRMYGEDTEMAARFFAARKKMVYTPHAIVQHKVPQSRMTLAYVRKWRYDKALDAPPAMSGKLPPFWLLKECVKNAFKALAAYCSGKQNEGIISEMQFWTQLGQIAGILNL